MTYIRPKTWSIKPPPKYIPEPPKAKIRRARKPKVLKSSTQLEPQISIFHRIFQKLRTFIMSH